jgi:hypothetical protein
MSVAQEVATLQTEVAVLKQQLLHANELRKADAERAAELLAVKDRELQSVNRYFTQALQLSRATGSQAPALSQDRAVRQRIESVSVPPVDDDMLLDKVFELVGPGDYFYVAGVCRRWRGRYMTLCYKAAAEKLEEQDEEEEVEVEGDHSSKLRTSFASAVRTADRLQLALDDKLTIAQLQATDFGYTVSYHSLEPVAVYALAKQYDLPWEKRYCLWAALHNKMDLLQWLLRRGCPWNIDSILALIALRKLHLPLLKWMRTKSGPWAAELQAVLLRTAVRTEAFAAADWLREQGAAWPNSFQAGAPYWVEWTLPMVKYALEHGASWGEWKCEKFSPDMIEQRMDPDDRQHAKELLAWAHANGCPCTCGGAQG